MSVFLSGHLPQANDWPENDQGTVDAESPDAANRPSDAVNRDDVRESVTETSCAATHPQPLVPVPEEKSQDVATGDAVKSVGSGESGTNEAHPDIKANGATGPSANAERGKADGNREPSSSTVQTFEKFWKRFEELTNPLTKQLGDLTTQLRRARIEHWIDLGLQAIRAVPQAWRHVFVWGLLLPTVIAVIFRASPTDSAPPVTQKSPIARADQYGVDQGQALIVGTAGGVLANDLNADGDWLVAVVVCDPKNGSVSLNSDGSFTYVPNANFSGTDNFTYKVKNSSNESEVADVAITVTHVNHIPVGNGDRYDVDQRQTLTVDTARGVLRNDQDADGDALSAVAVAHPTHGSLNLNGDGSFTYVPNSNFSSSDSFTYKAGDGLSESNVVKVSIAVNPVGDPEGAKGYFTDAVQDMRSNRLDPAVGNLIEAIRLDSGDARYFYLRAFASYFLGRINDAEADVRQGAEAERRGRLALSEINATLDNCGCQGDVRIKWFEPLRRKYLLPAPDQR